jgi:hypothetical protein
MDDVANRVTWQQHPNDVDHENSTTIVSERYRCCLSEEIYVLMVETGFDDRDDDIVMMGRYHLLLVVYVDRFPLVCVEEEPNVEKRYLVEVMWWPYLQAAH